MIKIGIIGAGRFGKSYSPGIPEAFSAFATAEAMMRSAETDQVVEIKQ